MIDRAKTIKQLDEIGHYFFDRYRKEDDEEESRLAYDRADTVANAIALLKEQEAVEPKIVPSKDFLWSEDFMMAHWYVCGGCEFPVNPGDNFCARCGRPIKWEDQGD